MKTNLLLAVAFAALVVSGCATHPRTSRYNCTTSPCVVTVTVDDCRISLDRDPLHVVRIRDAELVWELASPGYEFVADGIRFKPGSATGQFHRNSHAANRYKWLDRNTVAGRNEYGIKVKRTHGAACPEFDPVVVNEP